MNNFKMRKTKYAYLKEISGLSEQKTKFTQVYTH